MRAPLSDIALRRANQADIPFVMATERLDGYDQLVGRWERDRHDKAMADARYAYLIGEYDEKPVGFALLRDWNAANGITLVQRVAMARTGAGLGTALMRAVVEMAFTQTDVHRLAIGTFPDNLRARHVYEKVGFVAEGVARGAAFFGGRHMDELNLAILRPDWLARRATATL